MRLRSKGFPQASIESVLDELAREGVISDRRFAAALVRRRAEQGYGGVRIALELRQLGVDASALDEADVDWDDVLQRVYRKRYGLREPATAHDLNARRRYLLRRGFSVDQIVRFVRAPEHPDSFSDLSTC